MCVLKKKFGVVTQYWLYKQADPGVEPPACSHSQIIRYRCFFSSHARVQDNTEWRRLFVWVFWVQRLTCCVGLQTTPLIGISGCWVGKTIVHCKLLAGKCWQHVTAQILLTKQTLHIKCDQTCCVSLSIISGRIKLVHLLKYYRKVQFCSTCTWVFPFYASVYLCFTTFHRQTCTFCSTTIITLIIVFSSLFKWFGFLIFICSVY